MGKIIKFDIPFTKNLSEYLKKEYPEFQSFNIISKNLDARGAQRGVMPRHHYEVELFGSDEMNNQGDISQTEKLVKKMDDRPIIVGCGPAGLFCALRFLDFGVKSIILERGDDMHTRLIKVAHFFKSGKLDPESNIGFGQGGAGLYSDGKLTNRSKSPYVDYVMKQLVKFGAPEETRWIKNPHIGSNNVRKMIQKLCIYLEEMGCQIHYRHKVTDLLIKNGQITGVGINHQLEMPSPCIILATGHSSREMYYLLKHSGVTLLKKDFAVGLRVEHPRKLIDKIQYGKFAGHPDLKTASYKLTYHNQKNSRGTFSFCMCPGGLILSSGTEIDGIVTNGMSNSRCMSPWSNSALVVSVKSSDLNSDVLAGIDFQKSIENLAYQFSMEHARGKEIPAQMLKDFLDGKRSLKIKSRTSTPSGVFPFDFTNILPGFITEELRQAIFDYNRHLVNFISDEAVLLGPETRTSAPLQIYRDRESLESNIKGLYPIGEGAGWAGGIVSSAIDGINAANSITKAII